jgi:DNA replication protein DnaC
MHDKLPMADFFGWKYHPFSDTYIQWRLWMSKRDSRQLETIKRLLHTGKSIALCGPSGSGKTTLVHALINDLDKNSYRTVLIPMPVTQETVSHVFLQKPSEWRQKAEEYH